MDQSLDFIFNRRSIRRFTDQPVGEPVIQSLLEAAMAAPSACAKDPWHFLVLTTPEVRRKVAAFLPNGKFLADAPLGMIVLGDQKQAHAESLSYLLQDCSAAIENLLLAANALGLGACWLGVHPREDRIAGIRQYFQLPEQIVPVAAIALGYPAEPHISRTRFNADRVHFNTWNPQGQL